MCTLYKCIIYSCSRYLDLSLYTIMVTYNCSGSLVYHFFIIFTIIILQVLGFQSLSLLGYGSLLIKSYRPLELRYFAYLRGHFAKKRPSFLSGLFAMLIYEGVWRRDAFFEVTLQVKRPLHGETTLWCAQFVPEWFVFVFTWLQSKRESPFWGNRRPAGQGDALDLQ